MMTRMSGLLTNASHSLSLLNRRRSSGQQSISDLDDQHHKQREPYGDHDLQEPFECCSSIGNAIRNVSNTRSPDVVLHALTSSSVLRERERVGHEGRDREVRASGHSLWAR